MKYTPPLEAPCSFLKVEQFELRSPDSDDTDAEIPTYPNALPVCSCEQPCRYQTAIWPQAWHAWYAQTICMGWEVGYLAGDSANGWTVAPLLDGWWPEVAPLQLQAVATHDEQLALIRSLLITDHVREQFPIHVRNWGYAGAVAFQARLLAGVNTPENWHWPSARCSRGEILIWFVGKNWPAQPDVRVLLADYVREALPEPQPDGVQLTLF